METILVQTKFNPPPVSSDWIERPLLINRLNQNPDRMFTLVSAPAGFGKTTLIASWLAGQSCPYAWISSGTFFSPVTTIIAPGYD